MEQIYEVTIRAENFDEACNKPFDLRRGGFKLGDMLRLRECNYDGGIVRLTGRQCLREIVYVLPEGAPGLAEGFVGLGLGPRTSAQQMGRAEPRDD